MKILVMRDALLALLISIATSVAAGCGSSAEQEDPFRRARELMVRQQIQGRGITDSRLLEAFRTVPRHLFVPDSLRHLAYGDWPLPIGHDQTISQPYIVALMTSLAAIDSDSRVLEIGTGSGYQAAILTELAAEVYTIEIIPALADSARARLERLGYTNVHVRAGDGFRGWPEAAPFDAILVTCAAPEIPRPLIEQLVEGGRLVIPVGTDWQELLVSVKQDDTLVTTPVTPVMFVPMTGEAQEGRR